MIRVAAGLLALALALPVQTQAQVEDNSTVIASWNIRNLGWDNNKDFRSLGVVGSYFDFISVQEVMSEPGIVDFRDALEQETGTSWMHMCSDFVGRGRYKEMYCFVWRDEKITWVDGAVVYLDDRDVFAREPFSARFETADGFSFIATSVHSIYGDNVTEREKEARALRDYRDWLTENFSPTPIFLMGDFNLAPANPAWKPVGEVMFPLIQDAGTTLSTHDGRFASLYDNIWVEADRALPVVRYGRLEFPGKVLDISHQQARDTVTDHIPVWIEIEADAPAMTFAPHMPTGTLAAPYVAANPFARQPAAMRATFGAAPAQTAAAQIIGNRNSDIYHLPGCPSYGRVSAANQVMFSTEVEAVASGYRRAKNC